jgi:hypothetical protein
MPSRTSLLKPDSSAVNGVSPGLQTGKGVNTPVGAERCEGLLRVGARECHLLAPATNPPEASLLLP